MPKNLETGAKKPKPGKNTSFDRIVYRIEESGAGTDYQAVCPELVITGFGDTAEDAKDSLRREVAGYLQDCEELGVLGETLIEAGFYFNGEVWMSNCLPLDPCLNKVRSWLGSSGCSPSPQRRRRG